MSSSIQKPRIAVRGIRQNLPAGYVLGRDGPNTGHAQLISLTQLATKLVMTGVIPSAISLIPHLVDASGDVLDTNGNPILVP